MTEAARDQGTRGEFVARLAEAISSVTTTHPLRVAVDGPPASGKTTLADELAVVLRARGRDVIRASIDDFLVDRAQRYRRGRYSAEGCYFDAHDRAALCRILLDPLGPGGDRRFQHALFSTDTPASQPASTAPADAVLLFDGVFLLRPELIDRWDLRIFVSVPFEQTVDRAKDRDTALTGSTADTAEIERSWRNRYIPAQQLYFSIAHPTDHADIIVYNDRPHRPTWEIPHGKTAVGQMNHDDRTIAVHKTLEFAELLRLIDERATAFRAAVAAAPSLDLPVPTCPEWKLSDLVQHIGEGRRRWAATVAAGPDATSRTPAQGDAVAPQEREAVLAWLAASTELLLAALREAGPDQGCFTGWGYTQTPHTAGGVARHQVQEIAVHTYDAQLTVGERASLPAEVALDGVEENLFIASYSTSAWPHKPTAFDFHAAEGRSWRLTVDGDGARTTRLPATDEDPDAAGLSIRGTASDLVLFLYDRISVDSLQLDGDPALLDQLLAWEPEDWA